MATEIGLATGVSRFAVEGQLCFARSLIIDHPRLFALLRGGKVSGWGLRLVVGHTDVLDPHLRRVVDAQLADEVDRAWLAGSRWTPARLSQAAARRVLAADAAAAAKRAAKARADRQVSIRDRIDGTAPSGPG